MFLYWDNEKTSVSICFICNFLIFSDLQKETDKTDVLQTFFVYGM
jgi:hypothetical protein